MTQTDNSFQVTIADNFYQYNFNPQPSKRDTIIFAPQKNDWLEACDKENLNVVPHNYFLINVEASEFLKSINLGPIPRHLFYDKAGNLVHKNAPGPGSEEIQQLIRQYSKH